ncbi:ParD-like family protein, partial [Klebsiella pneumoniae]|nr:ParD-like family protein [Klebsiella pneumoniae]
MVLAIYATKCQGHPALDCIRCIYESLRYISMGIVKISDLLHDDIRDASKAMSR